MALFDDVYQLASQGVAAKGRRVLSLGEGRGHCRAIVVIIVGASHAGRAARVRCCGSGVFTAPVTAEEGRVGVSVQVEVVDEKSG